MIPGFGLVDRWLMARFLRAYATFTGAALVVFLIVDLFTNLDSLAREGLWTGMVQRYGVMLPEMFFTFSPFLTLVSALWVVGTLQRGNELVPLVSVGYSPLRLSWPLILIGGLLTPLAWADREYVLPAVAHMRRAEAYAQDRHEELRPIPDGEGGVLSARWYHPRTSSLRSVRYTRLDQAGGERFTVFAEEATPVPYAPGDPGGWLLREGVHVERRRTEAGVEDVITPVGPEGLFIESRVVLADVEAAVESPAFLSSEDLRRQLRRTPGFRHLEVQIYERVTYPLAAVVLLLLAVPIAIRGQGGWDSFLRFLACFALSFAYFVGSTFSYELGAREVLAPPVAAFLPLALAGLAGLGLSLRDAVRR